mmetsp:Transcript_98516/g.158862  ORF Transcript_98516/g.158862 Transcript_98516/m.158862 type:complete len:83 (+) Transcript_98516:368-616(+)
MTATKNKRNSKIAELSRAIAERNTVTQLAHASLDGLLRKLDARLELLQVPLGASVREDGAAAEVPQEGLINVFICLLVSWWL